MNQLQTILLQYGIEANEASIIGFGTGLINHTWKVSSDKGDFILQKINTDVFTNPHAIAANLELINNYFKIHFPDYLFVAPILSLNGNALVTDETGKACYRLFPFIRDSHAKNVLSNPEEAFEAAAQFGRFTRMLAGFDVNQLQLTIPAFHDLSLRYRQFENAIQNGNPKRIVSADVLIGEALSHRAILDEYESIKTNPSFKLRVTHHDTKISNVLFNSKQKAICIVDLDTVMPGYFISDVGDMMRTYLPTVNEEETDFSKVAIRENMFEAIVQGYSSEMKDELTGKEKNSFLYAGLFMIYMQALRFLTDYLNNDVYYNTSYPDQNYVRAKNQLILLERLLQLA